MKDGVHLTLVLEANPSGGEHGSQRTSKVVGGYPKACGVWRCIDKDRRKGERQGGERAYGRAVKPGRQLGEEAAREGEEGSAGACGG